MRSDRRRIVAGIVAPLALGMVLIGASGCSSDHAAPVATVSGVAAADVTFAQMMIPHHEQAVVMADMALDPKADASPFVTELAEEIRGAQAPEISQMQAWLADWGAPSAMPTDHDAHGGHSMDGMTMDGMMTDEQMAELAAAKGKAFDDLWLTMMIEHHEGAIVMAEQVRAQSDNPDVTALASAIIVAQRKEIAQMKRELAA
ncbi:MAG: DUF305 domain-containing protein [Candidatus Nanopelagicales bacterium]